ncbi:A24 family peptidase [Pantoea sp. 1.19]|uniref:prepilin peptidase n=1 Tax=Pantoea sp. 1.19 TaxID=1925589 RepID=UPI00094910CF|nr:A24 family peptidase [Pantoea sp. 1.19]
MDPEWLLWLLYALAALSVGSFLNVVICRLPQMILSPQPGYHLSLPASHCPQCRTPIRPVDNIPLLSWLRLRGRCRHCRQRVSWRYPAVELASLLIALLLAAWLPAEGMLLPALILTFFLLALSLIDARHQLLPDALTLPLLWLGLLFSAGFSLSPVTAGDAIIGAASGYVLFRLLAEGYRRLRGVDALGGGDAKLLAAAGAWLGWQPLPQLLLLASCGGLLAAFAARLFWRRPLHRAVPFGPWLAIATEILFLWPLR